MTDKKETSLTEKIINLDAKVIYGSVFIILIVSSLFPLGLPLLISEPTKEMYKTIDNLEEGDVFWFGFDIVYVCWAEMQAPLTAVLQHAFQKEGIKLVITSAFADGTVIFETLMKTIDTYGKVYGEDWVYLGYQPGGEMLIEGIARDIHGTYPTDDYGTPLSELPMMDDIHSAEDFALVFRSTLGPQFYWYIRQVVAPYGIPFITASVGYFFSEIMPFYSSGQLTAYIVGLRGGAEYEKLIGVSGVGARGADAMSLIYIIIIGVVALINILEWKDRFTGGK